MIGMVMRQEPGVVLALPLVKRLDVVNARAFRARLADAVAGWPRAILDLSLLEHLDCRGIEVLLELAGAAAGRGGALALAGLSHRLSGLLALAGVDAALPSFPTLAAARAGFGGR